MRASSVAMCYTLGLGHVGPSLWLATSVPLCSPLSLISGMVPDVLGSNFVYVFRKGSSWFGVPTNMLACLSNPER